MTAKLSIALLVLLLPVLTHAADFDSLLTELRTWVNTGTSILSALALLAFFWGLVKYIFAAGDEGAKAEGKKIMVGGVIALFVLFSVFGIIRFLQASFDLENRESMKPPSVQL